MAKEDTEDEVLLEEEANTKGEEDATEGEGHEEDEEEEATAKVDSELEDAADDDERAEIRARRKAERKSRSQHRREKMEALERNIAALMEQNQRLQQQVGVIQDSNLGSQIAQVDQAIDQATRAAEHFKNLIAQATARGDGKTVAEATEYMIASRERAKELIGFKQNATRAINAPKPLDPALVSKSQQFLGKNQWYKGPNASDTDSKILTAIDNSLTAEGWDPRSDAYWTELETRAKKHLAHRFQGETKRPRSTVPGSSAQGASSSASQESSFKLSPDRVAAIKAAGMWDDVAARNKMIKSYRDFDKTQRS